MANLIINRTREVGIKSDTFIKGMWKIEVVCPNGEIKKPLGDEWRPNLLMTRGLLNLAGRIDDWQSIASLMRVAQYGNRTNNATDRDYNNGIVNSTWATITTDAQLNGIFGWSGYSSVGGSGNTVVDDYQTGSRTFTKTYDFLATPNLQTVKEILITDYSSGNRGTGRAESDILSRFILPSPVVLEQYQFLRLTYSLQVTIPAIISPINIDVQSGDFNGLGQLKCIGQFYNIFGSMDSNGTPQCALDRVAGTTTIQCKRLPWTMIGQKCTGALMPGGDPEGTSQYQFPGVNVNIDSSIRKAPGSSYVYSDGPGGVIGNVGYSNGNLSYTRSATLLFPATNPNLTEQYIGGILITTRINSNDSYYDMREDSLGYSAWYWRFTDALGNPRGQLKDINFALAINVENTASIT